MTDLTHFMDAEGRLVMFPAKRKMKLQALLYLAGKFEKDRIYTEKEVNALLSRWHTFGDPATLRRELYHHRLLNREPSGASYWLEPVQPDLAALMDKYSGRRQSPSPDVPSSDGCEP